MMNNIMQLAKEIQENSAAKGFWHEGPSRSKGEMVKLMICETSEGVEAHRNRTGSDLKEFMEQLTYYVLNDPPAEVYKIIYEDFIKGSIEEEMADTIIRVLDYIYGWNILYEPREYRKETTGNVAHDLLRIDHYILSAFHEVPGKDWGYVIAAIEKFCEWHKIDLQSHVEWKMKYNSYRSQMHGKRY